MNRNKNKNKKRNNKLNNILELPQEVTSDKQNLQL